MDRAVTFLVAVTGLLFLGLVVGYAIWLGLSAAGM